MSTHTHNTDSQMIKSAEFNRFGLVAIIILLIGCMGGIAVGLGAINHVFSLVMVVFPTMATLSLLLAVAPMKWILTSGLISVIIDVLLITYFIAFT